MRKLRIALIAPGIPESSTGPSIWVKELAERLCDAGQEVTVVTADLATRGVPAGPMVRIDDRITLKLFPVTSQVGRRFYYSAEMKRWLNENIGQFDVVDIQGVWSFVAVHAAKACINANVPYVITTHGQMAEWDWRKNYWIKRLFFSLQMLAVWRSAAAIRFVSTGEVSHSMIVAGPHGVVIPYWINATNRINIDAVKRLCHELSIPSGAFVTILLGRITAQKGVLEVLSAFDRFWRSCPSAFLLLAGPLDTDYGSEVAKMMAQLPSRSQIQLLGPVYGERKFQLFSLASVFITLSKNEGLPIAALEAMSSGLPVILTDRANLPEVGEYCAGEIVTDTPEAVACALEALFADRARLRKMGEQAKKLAEERFTPEVVMPQMLTLYRRIANKGR